MNKELLNCERVWLNVTPATLRSDLADYGLLEPHALGVHEGGSTPWCRCRISRAPIPPIGRT